MLVLDLPDSDADPWKNAYERLHMYQLLGSLQQYWHGRQDVRVLQYQTDPSGLAEDAEPAHPYRAFRCLDLFVVLYVAGMIPKDLSKFQGWRFYSDHR